MLSRRIELEIRSNLVEASLQAALKYAPMTIRHKGMPPMTVEIESQFAERLNHAQYIWFTTVRADGMPQPTPVWFIGENDDTFLIYTTVDAQKLRNLKANAKVALSYNESDDADDYLVIMGEAKVDRSALAVIDNAAYLEKYRQGIADINMTPESFSESYSIAIRVTASHVRGE
jgi:PPOX class probable F420-dependent enzyme